MTAQDLEHFVLTITVECSPLDSIDVVAAEIENFLFAFMCNAQLAALVRMWQTYNKGTELSCATGGVDVWPKLVRRAGINLSRIH